MCNHVRDWCIYVHLSWSKSPYRFQIIRFVFHYQWPHHTDAAWSACCQSTLVRCRSDCSHRCSNPSTGTDQWAPRETGRRCRHTLPDQMGLHLISLLEDHMWAVVGIQPRNQPFRLPGRSEIIPRASGAEVYSPLPREHQCIINTAGQKSRLKWRSGPEILSRVGAEWSRLWGAPSHHPSVGPWRDVWDHSHRSDTWCPRRGICRLVEGHDHGCDPVYSSCRFGRATRTRHTTQGMLAIILSVFTCITDKFIPQNPFFPLLRHWDYQRV